MFLLLLQLHVHKTTILQICMSLYSTGNVCMFKIMCMMCGHIHVVSRVKCILHFTIVHVCHVCTPQTVLLYLYTIVYARGVVHVVHIQIVHVPVVKNSYL
jgi:hypothetical protein